MDVRTAVVGAVLVALLAGTGSAVAAKLITSADIADGTIQPRDLSGKTREALRSQRGSRGPRGDRGRQGVAGPTGPRGLTGRRGATGRRGRTGRRGATGLVRAFASTTPSGRVTNGNGLVVTRVSAGRYCVARRRGTGARRPAVIVATPFRTGSQPLPLVYRDPAGDGGCPNGGALVAVDTPTAGPPVPTDAGLSLVVP